MAAVCMPFCMGEHTWVHVHVSGGGGLCRTVRSDIPYMLCLQPPWKRSKTQQQPCKTGSGTGISRGQEDGGSTPTAEEVQLAPYDAEYAEAYPGAPGSQKLARSRQLTKGIRMQERAYMYACSFHMQMQAHATLHMHTHADVHMCMSL